MTDAPNTAADAPEGEGHEDSPLTYVGIWLALMVLLALTVLGAHFLHGTLSTAVGLAVATVKAGLVVWIFMQLRHHHGLTRVAAFFALLWLMILITLMLSDYLTRVRLPV